MRATGRLFLSRTRPVGKAAADGTFGLQLYALDRIGQHQTESWVVCWYGPEAQAFWQQHQAALVPGAVVQVEARSMRAHYVRSCVPEIHATASHIELEASPARIAPAAHPAQATA